MGEQYTLRLLVDDSAVRKLEERLNKIMGLGSTTTGSSTSSGGGLFGGNIGKNILKLGTIAVGIGSLITLVKKISELALESSPVLQAMFKIFNTSIMLIFRPIGDFIGFFLRPIVVYFLRNIAIPYYQKWAPIANKLGTFLGDFVMPGIDFAGKNLLSNWTFTPLPEDPLVGTNGFFTKTLPDSFKKWQDSIGKIDFANIPAKIGGIFDNLMKRLNRYFIDFIVDMRKPLDKMFSFFTGVWNYMSEKLKPLWDAVQGFFNWIIETFKPLIDFVANLFKPYETQQNLSSSGQGKERSLRGGGDNYEINVYGASGGSQQAIDFGTQIRHEIQKGKRTTFR